MNIASGGDGIPVELSQILKDDAVKVLHQYASKFGKLISGHRTVAESPGGGKEKRDPVTDEGRGQEEWPF